MVDFVARLTKSRVLRFTVVTVYPTVVQEIQPVVVCRCSERSRNDTGFAILSVRRPEVPTFLSFFARLNAGLNQDARKVEGFHVVCVKVAAGQV